MPFLKNNNIQYTIFTSFFQGGSRDKSSEALRKSQRRRKFGERGEREGRRTAFKAVFVPRMIKEASVLCTASVSPLDRDKDTVLDPRKMLAHFSVNKISRNRLIAKNAMNAMTLNSDCRRSGVSP